jgi:hypothetical protein
LDANNHEILQPHSNTQHCRQSVTVLTINQNEIVIAANSAMVANYLRLHSKQLRQISPPIFLDHLRFFFKRCEDYWQTRGTTVVVEILC